MVQRWNRQTFKNKKRKKRAVFKHRRRILKKKKRHNKEKAKSSEGTTYSSGGFILEDERFPCTDCGVIIKAAGADTHANACKTKRDKEAVTAAAKSGNISELSSSSLVKDHIKS